MHFEGQQSIQASMDAAWAFLLDAERVAGCAPGYQKMEVLSPEHFKPVVAISVGPVKATFTLDVTLSQLQPPRHAEMRGRGLAAGSAVDVHSTMDLEATSDGSTTMSWAADVTVSGTIASMGARLLEGTAEKMAARFFDCIRQQLEAAALTPAK